MEIAIALAFAALCAWDIARRHFARHRADEMKSVWGRLARLESGKADLDEVASDLNDLGSRISKAEKRIAEAAKHRETISDNLRDFQLRSATHTNEQVEKVRAELRALHSSMAAREANAPIRPQKRPYQSIMGKG